MRKGSAGRWKSRNAAAAALLLAAAITAASPTHVLAQGASAQPSVFVPDSSVATERFSLAEKLERAYEWTKAAEVYQELLDNYRDRVVPAGGEPEDAVIYVSVADRAMRQLAAWPPEGLAAYNGRHQPAAEQLLQAATSPADLRLVVDRYALTRAGQLAASRLIQIYWDYGELASAAALADRMASLLPAASERKPLLLAQAGIAWHLAGNTGRAQLILQMLKRDYPQATGLLAGKEQLLAAALEQACQVAPPEDTPPGAWPSYGGTPDRAAVPDFKGRSDALLFSIDIASSARSRDTGAASMAQLRMLLNQMLAVHPVYDQRQLFFHDGVNLHAVSIDGGIKLPGWQSSTVQLASEAPAGPMLRTVALADDAVYAVLADSATPIVIGAAAQENSAIFCVDRHTGSLRWRVTPSTLAQNNELLKTVQFASPPLIAEDKLFVAARGGRNAQFHDVYVLCLDRRDGRLLWSSYVASGPNVNMMLMDEMPFAIESGLPQLSLHAGRIIVTTNLGAIAALETSDGTPAWLHTYSRVDLPPGRMVGRFIRPGQLSQPVARIFAASPAVVTGGLVFALPVDAKNILILDEVTGRPVKQISRTSVGNADTLIGVTRDTLVLSGEKSAIALDWKQANEDGEDQYDATRWQMEFPANSLRGRPFLTADSLFLPTDDRLLRIGTDKWKIEQTTPPYPDTWDLLDGPGNVIVTEEHVVVASARKVRVYTNLDTATARLDREVAAAPGSIEPLVQYGELLFAAGRYDASLEKFQAAYAIAQRDSSQAAGRDRLFSAVLSCALRLASQDSSSPHWKPLLDVARDVAGSPSQRVQYHFGAATMYLRNNDGSSSLAELQAVLDDPQQRTVTYRDADGTSRSSAEIARRQIAQLIDRYGNTIYQPVERQARAALADAQGARDTAALLALAQRYPNSSAAPLALYTAGQIQESQGRLAEASSTYRQLVQNHKSHPEIASFIEALARVYASIPGKAQIAAGRLAQAAALYNDPVTRSPIKLPSGQIIQPGPFSRVADAIRSASGAHQVRPLPDFRLPAMGESPFAESIELQIAARRVLPHHPGTEINFRKAVVLTVEGSIAVVDNEGNIVATFDDPAIVNTDPTDCAWIDENTLLLRNANEMFALDITAGRETWRVVPEQLPDASELADQNANDAEEAVERVAVDGDLQMQVPDQMVIMQRAQIRGAALIRGGRIPDGITAIRIVAGKVIFGTSTGRLAAIDATTGNLLWQLRPKDSAIANISCSDDFTAARVIGARKSLLLCVDNDTGRLIFQRNFTDDPLQNILVTSDGQLIYTTLGTIASRDLFDQGERVIFENPPQERGMEITRFLGQERFDQLVLVDNVIVATTDRGANVRMFSRYTGKQISPGGQESNSAAANLQRVGRTSRTQLVAAEPYVYACNPQSIRAINVQRRESPERRLPRGVMNLAQIFPGARHLVAFEQPLQAANEPTVSELTLFAFGRSIGTSGESGRLDHMHTFKIASGINSYQLMEGGIYLATGDNRLIYYKAK